MYFSNLLNTYKNDNELFCFKESLKFIKNLNLKISYICSFPANKLLIDYLQNAIKNTIDNKNNSIDSLNLYLDLNIIDLKEYENKLNDILKSFENDKNIITEELQKEMDKLFIFGIQNKKNKTISFLNFYHSIFLQSSKEMNIKQLDNEIKRINIYFAKNKLFCLN
jgi:hypothetical protein